MKTYLCDKIERENFSDIRSIINGVVTFYTGHTFATIGDIIQAIYTEEMEPTAAGPLITQKLTITTEIDVSAANGYNTIHQIFRLTFSNSTTPFIWGSLNNPVLCSDNFREFSTTKIVFVRKTTQHEV